MIDEPAKLSKAREHLHLVEQTLVSPDAEFHLEEGFYLLEDIIEHKAGDAAVATTLGETYFTKLLAFIREELEPRDVPEPRLKHLMKLTQVLGNSSFGKDVDVPALTAKVARRYIDSVFEGYSPADKKRAIKGLMVKLGPPYRGKIIE
ncbi:MAG: hypothetical protein O7E57_09585 [Gammaproteobacteria bacterium]|nr:hypothetical protein [Gammaproteobacteria bacterium]